MLAFVIFKKKPVSTWQRELQPSLLMTSASSHFSIGKKRKPSPQIGRQISFELGVPPSHFQPKTC